MKPFQNLLCFTVSVAIFFCSSHQVSSTVLKNNNLAKAPHLTTGSEYLDAEKHFLVKWTINHEEETIYFDVTADTKGYVGFGISPNGAMTGADILIAGVDQNKIIYSKDYHGIGNKAPVEDAHADWNVTLGEETNTQTKLSFHRLLNTCDDEDFKITDATMHIIWAMGESDDVNYHKSNKGAKSVNLFIQGDEDFDSSELKNVDLTMNTTMPSQHTTYWCSIHALPLFEKTQHIVAFEPILESLDAIRHTHHFIFHRCIAPENENPDVLFGKWVNHTGNYCYKWEQRLANFPFLQYCNGNMIFVWSKGGKRTVFPSTLGLPMPEKLGQREYYAMEVHYDNPTVVENLSFKTGGRIYYTDVLREKEAGILNVDHTTRVQLTVPPLEKEYVVSGHCSSECTQEYLPEEGITVFNNLLHAHLTGRKLKLRHFRGNQELPWVDSDDYYDFDYQQNKQLSKETKVMRGDQLTVECTFDTMGVANKAAVIGGLSSHEEMCQAYFFYYPKQNVSRCGSAQEIDHHMDLLGITDYKLKESEYNSGLQTYEVTKPASLAGDYLDSISFKVNWTEEFREKFQKEKRFGEHISNCGIGRQPGIELPVAYPKDLKEYVPTDVCKTVQEVEI